MKDIECPYCGEENEVNHDDGGNYEENVFHQMECVNCEKTFAFTAMLIFHYTPYKADCLNGAPHAYKFRRSYPSDFSKMKCKNCGEERELTGEERIKFKIVNSN